MSLSVESFKASAVMEEDEMLATAGKETAGGKQGDSNKTTAGLECPVCMFEKPMDCFLEISTCHHRCCSQCLREYFKIEIMESRLAIACPECSELFHPNDIKAIVQDDTLMQKYEDFMLRRVLAMDSDTRWCPAPDCGFAVLATGCAGCPKLKCEREGCGTYFCYHCKQYWHPNQTCDAAWAERSPNLRSASLSYIQELSMQNEIKPCPRCGAFIVKMDDGSCNHMTCAVCGAGFCWLCLKEISDLHYLSPSGCTFWGRKPWSRKKKILWQLGTLVGAPVGITLVAGIAVPAMIIGIPVWVGRKIHFRYVMASKHKRNLAITGGVAASILAAPIIAGLAVGIGVPILLAYVYGVVSFSLCRNGGCGVTTTYGGVKFDFDEQDENNTQGPYSYAGDNHSIETAPNVANPSIAPSIGDASLGMTNSLSASGSHMERAGVLRDDSDRDSSSHRAIAGNSINGSLCSATYGAQHHKLEVQADISEHAVHCERSSVGGESYSMSMNDDASTRALAGSIVSPKDKDGISLCSRHFDSASGGNHYTDGAAGKEEECSMCQHQRGSSSCPTSPHLRKASPAPSEDTRNTRGKKCTRFMDQVSEIESKSDCLSIGSINSNNSTSVASPVSPSGGEVGVIASPPVHSTLSRSNTSTCTSTKMTQASCESLMSEGKAESASVIDGSKSYSLCHGGRLKAESTSVLMDGADMRRCEMGGARRKSESTTSVDLNPADRPLTSRKKSRGVGDKEHRSQPGNLSDISELRGMPTVHTAGCSNLLAVMDTSCENVFLDKTGKLVSGSSLSSSDEMPDFGSTKLVHHPDNHTLMEAYSNLEELQSEGYCNGIMSNGVCCLSDVTVMEKNGRNDDRFRSGGCHGTESPTEVPVSQNNKLTMSVHHKKAKGNQVSSPRGESLDSKKDLECDVTVPRPQLCKRDSCVSRTSIGSDPVTVASLLPDVEMPVSVTDTELSNNINNTTTPTNNNTSNNSISLSHKQCEDSTIQSPSSDATSCGGVKSRVCTSSSPFQAERAAVVSTNSHHVTAKPSHPPSVIRSSSGNSIPDSNHKHKSSSKNMAVSDTSTPSPKSITYTTQSYRLLPLAGSTQKIVPEQSHSNASCSSTSPSLTATMQNWESTDSTTSSFTTGQTLKGTNSVILEPTGHKLQPSHLCYSNENELSAHSTFMLQLSPVSTQMQQIGEERQSEDDRVAGCLYTDL